MQGVTSTCRADRLPGSLLRRSRSAGAGAQPPQRRSRHPARSAGRADRRERVGEELAGVRHDLRGGPAAVHRVPLQLRPAVPRPARAARRRPDRGPAADRRDRPAGRARPARGARSGRSPRSTTTSACCSPGSARRTARSAACRSTARRPSRWSRHVLAFPPGRKAHDPGPAGPGSEGAARRGLSGHPPRGPDPGPGGWRGRRGRRRASQAGQDQGPHDRGRRRSAGRSARGSAPGWPRASTWRSSSRRARRRSRPRSTARWEDHVLSVHLACPGCGTGLPTLGAASFSFNSPQGACPTCEGLGVVPTRSTGSATDEPVPCPDCQGSRLRPEARAVRIEGRSIDQVFDTGDRRG